MRELRTANPVYVARKRYNLAMLAVSSLALAFGLFWLVWILTTLLIEGGSALLRLSLYTQTTPPPGIIRSSTRGVSRGPAGRWL